MLGICSCHLVWWVENRCVPIDGQLPRPIYITRFANILQNQSTSFNAFEYGIQMLPFHQTNGWKFLLNRFLEIFPATHFYTQKRKLDFHNPYWRSVLQFACTIRRIIFIFSFHFLLACLFICRLQSYWMCNLLVSSSVCSSVKMFNDCCGWCERWW